MSLPETLEAARRVSEFHVYPRSHRNPLKLQAGDQWFRGSDLNLKSLPSHPQSFWSLKALESTRASAGVPFPSVDPSQ